MPRTTKLLVQRSCRHTGLGHTTAENDELFHDRTFAATARGCRRTASIACILAFFAFLRALTSPSGHKWQWKHSRPCVQPGDFQYHAQGLHNPTLCSNDPCEGSSAEVQAGVSCSMAAQVLWHSASSVTRNCSTAFHALGERPAISSVRSCSTTAQELGERPVTPKRSTHCVSRMSGRPMAGETGTSHVLPTVPSNLAFRPGGTLPMSLKSRRVWPATRVPSCN